MKKCENGQNNFWNCKVNLDKKRKSFCVCFDWIRSRVYIFTYSYCCRSHSPPAADYALVVNYTLLSRADLWHLGKGWILRDTTTRRLPYRANGLFYPSWDRLYRFTAYHHCDRLPSNDLTLHTKLMQIQLHFCLQPWFNSHAARTKKAVWKLCKICWAQIPLRDIDYSLGHKPDNAIMARSLV